MVAQPIFLSHSHHDTPFCERLVEYIRLREPNADIFFDHQSVMGGDDWMTRVQREVVVRPIFLVVISLASVQAEWVREETNLALRLAIKDAQRCILPVIRQESDVNQLAPLLMNRQAVDCATQNEQFGFEQIVGVLRTPESSKPIVSNPAYEDARRRASEVHDYVSANQWSEAATLGNFAVTLPGNDRDAELLGEVGIALLRIGKVAEGVARLDEALHINRWRMDLWREKAQAMTYQIYRPDDAAMAWGMAIAATTTPQGRLNMYLEACDGLNVIGKWQDALRLNMEAEKINVQVPRIWISRGDSLLFLNQLVEAVKAYDYALVLDPNAAAAWKGKSFALVQMGAYAAALPLCEQFLAIYPQDGSAWSTKGKALAGLNNIPQALQSADRALALEPSNALYMGEKASYFLRINQYGTALPVLEQAIALLPNLAYFWSLKAQALHGLRRFDEARAAELCAHDLGG